MRERFPSHLFSRLTSRRVFLHGLTAGLTVPFVPWLSFSRSARATQKDSGQINVARPSFSLAERDRRWGAIRRNMAKPQWDLDAILAPGSGDKAYPRYLTQIGGRGGSADVVFPRDASKSVVALVGSSRNRRFWEARLGTWRSDGKLIILEGEGFKSVAEQIKGLGWNRAEARIGVAKLVGSRFDREGLVPSTYLENLRSALPGIQFVPLEKWGADSGPIDEAAMVKSPEEQEVVRRCVGAGEIAVEVIRRSARPPARHQGDVWLPTFAAMFAETGEDPTRLSIALDAEANATLGAPTDDPLKEGQIISEEIDATVQGYRAQVNHSIFVGSSKTPEYDYYRLGMETAIKIFFESLAFVVPGKTTCGQLVDHYAQLVQKYNVEDRSGVVLHSSGIANLSRPRLGPTNSRQDSDIVLVPGMTFNFKPAIRLKQGAAPEARRGSRVVQIGDHLLITERGAIRLGKRELKPLTTES